LGVSKGIVDLAVGGEKGAEEEFEMGSSMLDPCEEKPKTHP